MYIFILLLAIFSYSYAGETHKDDHKDEHKDKHEEENTKIGPGKGITAFSKDDGFKISNEAEVTFELKYTSYANKGPIEVPKSAVFFGLEEQNLYRQRNGFFKRIDFKEVNKSGNNIKVVSDDLKPGDRIVITGIGFLRIVEISASGGLGEGHHH